MTSLYLARRLRVLTETMKVCADFSPAAHDVHGFCLRCGGEELPHVARLAAEKLDPLDPDLHLDDRLRRFKDDDAARVDVAAIDIINRQGVSLAPDGIIVMCPQQRMTAEAALVHAAWLIVVADRFADVSFASVYARVLGT